MTFKYIIVGIMLSGEMAELNKVGKKNNFIDYGTI